MTIFFKILIAHIITDFFIQPTKWVEDKKEKKGKSKYLYLHVILTGIVAWLILWDFKYWDIVLFITITHFIIDWCKITLMKDTLSTFLIDQFLHLLVLLFCALYSFGIFDLNASTSYHFPEKSLAVLAAFLFITKPAGLIVGKATQRWRAELSSDESERDSLKDAGVWIGILERILVLIFVLFNEFQAIGFLIAAKSILRFSSKSEDNPRMQSEYVLIGTLISFTIALVVGLFVMEIG